MTLKARVIPCLEVKDGRFVNPLGEKFIPGQPLDGAERNRFLRDARELTRRLEDEAPL